MAARTIHRQYTDPSVRSRGSTRRSDDSYNSQSTAPTSLQSSPRPSLQHASTAGARKCTITYAEDFSPCTSIHEHDSTDSYASTAADDIYDEPEELCRFDSPAYSSTDIELPRASTPEDFAEFFPSQRRLLIKHDDTTSDGNWNLRVDTDVIEGRHRVPLTLFHLRMQDLKSRRFSLRRYCRESGREVCHSSRKYTKPVSERPGIQRSMSAALANLRIAPPTRTNSWGSSKSNKSSKSAKTPTRQDSGYGSNEEEDDSVSDDEDLRDFMAQDKPAAPGTHATKTTQLEFSNYAQVSVSRHGSSSHKRYCFEYWGYTYAWKRISTQSSTGKRVSFHLVRLGSADHEIAHIVPEKLSARQVRAEEEAGGWVPPSSLWIEDKKAAANSDLADVIVATGLIALVDDCIKAKFSPKHKSSRGLGLSVPGTQKHIEFVGPRALVDAWKRRGSVDKERERAPESPLRKQVPAY